MLKSGNRGWWRGVLLLTGLLVLAISPGVALQTTIISDTVYRADGTPAQGTVLLSWPAFTAADGSAVAAGNETLTIGTNGALSVALTPNAGATPQGSYYTAVYHLNDGTVQKEYWVVPQGAATTLSAIRANVVPAAVAQTWSNQASINAALSSMESSFLPLKGGTVSGPITLPGDPSNGLQAATKQYVDSRTNLPLNAIPYQGSTGTAVVAATYDKIVAPFHSMAYVSASITNIGTAFNEASAGAGLIGTRPTTDVPGAAWISSSGTTTGGGVFASGGGAQFGPANAGNSTIALLDTGKADFTWTLHNVHLSGSTSGGFQIYARANNPLSAAEVIQWSPGGTVTVQDVTGSGSPGTVASGQTSGVSGDIVVTLSGQTITVSWFGTAITGTIPTNKNSGNTFIGFNPNGSLGNINDWAMTVSSMSVVSSGMAPSQVACNGIMHSDGTCGTVLPNQGVATDPNGHTTHLGEVQYSTDSTGNTTIACQEDHQAGVYDPRCSRYAGGIYGPTPAAAAQAMSNQMACDLAMGVVSHATAKWPQGNFPWDNLQIAPGSNWEGTPTSLGGTSVYTPFNNHQLAVAPVSMTVTCSDGQPHTDSADQTRVAFFNAGGCGQGTCSNASGDNGNYPNGGAGNVGLDMQSTGGVVENWRDHNFGGYGLRISGQDTKFHKFWSYNDLEYYYFGGYTPAGDTSGPNGTAWHGQDELIGTDVQGDFGESYGFLDAPTANTFLHVADILTGGGGSVFSHLWPQLGVMGIAQPYGFGQNNLFTDLRIDFARTYGFYTNDTNTRINGALIQGSCTSPNALTINTGIPGTSTFLAGTCEQLLSTGGNTNISNVLFAQNAGFGPTVQTGDFYIGNGEYHNIQGMFDHKSSDQGLPYQQNVNWEPVAGAEVASVTGAAPSVDRTKWISPTDTAANTITSFQWVAADQDFYVKGGNAQVTIQNNASIALCGGQNVNLGTVTGWLHFRAVGIQIYGLPATVSQVCGAAGTASLASPSTQAFSGPISTPQVGTIYQVDGFPSSCTVGGINYTTKADCAFYTAKSAAVASSSVPTLQFGAGVYQTCAGFDEGNATAYGVSLRGVGATAQGAHFANPSTTLQAICPVTNVIQHPDTPSNVLANLTITDITVDANNKAQHCWDIDAVSFFQMRNTVCGFAAGTDFAARLGDPAPTGGFTGGNYNIYLDNVYVVGNGTLQSNWANVTATQTGGVPSFTVVSGGGPYRNAGPTAYLFGNGSSGTASTPCTTMGTLTVTMSGSSVGSVTGSGFAGCGGAMYVWVPDIPPTNYGIIITASDSTIKDLDVANIGQQAGLQNNSGNIHYIHLHTWDQIVGTNDFGGGTYDSLEIDSPIHYGMVIQGATTVVSSKSFWNAAMPGSEDFYIAATASGAQILNHSCGDNQTAGGYAEIASPNGIYQGTLPTVNSTVVWPAGVTAMNAKECGGGYQTLNYTTGTQRLYGSLNLIPLGFPTITNVVPNTTGATTVTYEAVAVALDGTYSKASPTVTITNSAASPGMNNTITWSSSGNATSYNVYCTAGCSTLGKVNAVPVTGTTYTDTKGVGDGNLPTLEATSGKIFLGNNTTQFFALGVDHTNAFDIFNSALNTSYLQLNSNQAIFSGGIAGNDCSTTFSATPSFATNCYINRIVLNGNVTSSTIAAGTDGQPLCLNVVQNSTGGFTFAYPTNWVGGVAVGATANKRTVSCAVYSSVDGAWLVINQANE